MPYTCYYFHLGYKDVLTYIKSEMSKQNLIRTPPPLESKKNVLLWLLALSSSRIERFDV